MKKVNFFILNLLFLVNLLVAQNYGNDTPVYLKDSDSKSAISIKKYNELESDLKNLKNENKNLKSENEIFRKEIKILKSENEQLNNDIKNLETVKAEFDNLRMLYKDEVQKAIAKEVEIMNSKEKILNYAVHILQFLILVSFIIFIIVAISKYLKNKQVVSRYEIEFYEALKDNSYSSLLEVANEKGKLALKGLDAAKRKFDIDNNYQILEEYKENFETIFVKKINSVIQDIQGETDKETCASYLQELLDYNVLLVKNFGELKELAQKNKDLSKSNKDGIKTYLSNLFDRLEATISTLNSLRKNSDIDILLDFVIKSYNKTLEKINSDNGR